MGVKYVTTHSIDGKEVSFEEWRNNLQKDVKKENEELGWDISSATYSDIGNGRDVDVNGHYYEQRTHRLYDSGKELFDDLMSEGQYDVILDVLTEMSEVEIFNIISKLKCVTVKTNNKLLLKDEKDWE